MPNNIFIDTDAIIALARMDDSNHEKAVELQEFVNEDEVKIYTSNFVVGEIITVLSQKSSVAVAEKIGKEIVGGNIAVIYITGKQMKKALKKFSKQTSKNSRFTDIVNMVLMDELKIDTIFSFDNHYPKNGYKLLSTK